MSKVRLLSPQYNFIVERKKGNKASFHLDDGDSLFTFTSGKTLSFEYSTQSTLPITKALNEPKNNPSAFLSALSYGRLNISTAQEELLK